MAFKLVTRPEPAGKDRYMTNSEAAIYGECMTFASGRLTKAAPAAAVAAVTLNAVTAGTDKLVKIVIVEPSQEWEADYTGTPAGGFVVGCASADLDSTGANLDSADVTGGPCSIISIDSVNKKAIVRFKNRQLT